MMDEKKLLDAMSDIDENYIQDAKNFRERKVVRGRFAAKSVAAAAIVVLLAGTTVYGATVLVKQLHMKGYTSVENLAKDHDIKPWQSNIGYQDADFNEDGFYVVFNISGKEEVKIFWKNEETFETICIMSWDNTEGNLMRVEELLKNEE